MNSLDQVRKLRASEYKPDNYRLIASAGGSDVFFYFNKSIYTPLKKGECLIIPNFLFKDFYDLYSKDSNIDMLASNNSIEITIDYYDNVNDINYIPTSLSITKESLHKYGMPKREIDDLDLHLKALQNHIASGGLRNNIKTCTCGSDSIGGGMHSSWCDKGE